MFSISVICDRTYFLFYPNANVGGGVIQTGITDVFACTMNCMMDANCFGFDFDMTNGQCKNHFGGPILGTPPAEVGLHHFRYQCQ